jgi:hypothetical protein
VSLRRNAWPSLPGSAGCTDVIPAGRVGEAARLCERLCVSRLEGGAMVTFEGGGL